MSHLSPLTGCRIPVTFPRSVSSVSPPGFRPRSRAWILLFVLLLFAAEPFLRSARALGVDAAQEFSEYEVKARCLGLYVTRYIKWPEASFKEKDSPFVIAVLGKDPFGPSLTTVMKGRKAGEHPIKVVAIASIDELLDCQLLFMPSASEKQLPKVLEFYKDKSTLIVAESALAAENGAHVGMYLEKSKLSFTINAVAAKHAKLELSSELLKLAKLTKDKTEQSQ